MFAYLSYQIQIYKILLNNFIQQCKRKITRRHKSDLAAGSLIMVIFSMPILALSLGLVTDLIRDQHLKSVQDNQAQFAVESAIKSVGPTGSLVNFTIDPQQQIPDAVYKVDQEYKDQYSPKYNSNIVGQSNIAENTGYKFSNCSMMNVKQYGSSTTTVTKMPYILVTLDVNRSVGNTSNSVVYAIEGNDTPKLVSGTLNQSLKYKVVTADVQDSVGNFMLGMAGMPCALLKSQVSAITFGSQGDLKNLNQ